MKDGYRYIDGKIEITDYSDNGIRELEYRHYQDNIEEILITENTIEELQKRKEDIKKYIEENNSVVIYPLLYPQKKSRYKTIEELLNYYMIYNESIIENIDRLIIITKVG